MQVRLLGTGSADGWPNPWCACASCAAAARAGVLRGASSALIDDRLLIDAGPDAGRSALRHGTSLASVEAALVTHAHPDHHHGPAWQWRGWVPDPQPLVLVAPPTVLRDARRWLDPSVRTVAVAPEDRVSVAGYDVVALPAHHGDDSVGPPVLYDVSGPDGGRLLWASDTGVLPARTLELCAGRAYDLVLMELTSSGIAVHLDLRTWPEQVAALRRVGAVTAATQLVAVHLGHGNPPPAELDRVLAGWGASAPPDGTVLQAGGARPAPGAPRRVLVVGGARSGKSAYAEQLLAARPAVTYVATAPARPDDEEWAVRVAAHADRRPAGWATVETGDVAGALAAATNPVLVDDLGLWLTRELDAAGVWDAAEGPAQDAAERAVADAEQGLVDAWRRCAVDAVLVAPLVGSGVVPATAAGRRFRDGVGRLTARLAAVSDEVVEVVAGLPRRLR